MFECFACVSMLAACIDAVFSLFTCVLNAAAHAFSLRFVCICMGFFHCKALRERQALYKSPILLLLLLLLISEENGSYSIKHVFKVRYDPDWFVFLNTSFILCVLFKNESYVCQGILMLADFVVRFWLFHAWGFYIHSLKCHFCTHYHTSTLIRAGDNTLLNNIHGTKQMNISNISLLNQIISTCISNHKAFHKTPPCHSEAEEEHHYTLITENHCS